MLSLDGLLTRLGKSISREHAIRRLGLPRKGSSNQSFNFHDIHTRTETQLVEAFIAVFTLRLCIMLRREKDVSGSYRPRGTAREPSKQITRPLCSRLRFSNQRNLLSPYQNISQGGRWVRTPSPPFFRCEHSARWSAPVHWLSLNEVGDEHHNRWKVLHVEERLTSTDVVCGLPFPFEGRLDRQSIVYRSK